MHAPGHSHIYLSPHLDDAVLSCGGTIYAQSRRDERVLVMTVFAGSPPDVNLTPFTRELWERWGGADDPVAARRAEDRAALEMLGAEVLHLSYLDCVYRQDPATGEALYPTVEHIFAEVQPAESALADALYRDLHDRLASIPGPLIYAPLGAGHHVDHQIARRVVIRLRAEGAPVMFYEDWPYAGEAEAIARALQGDGQGWRRRISPLSEEMLAAKGNAVACYASQISTFWPDLGAMRRALRQQAERVGGAELAEGFWCRRCTQRSHPTGDRPIGSHL
jgi:LmbE family N-acetylglucosaminyl deacetylase